MKVNFKLLSQSAKAPVYSSKSAAGADLHNDGGDLVIEPNQTVFAGTGIAMQIPEGYVGLVFARSGLACKQGLAPANKVGVIDSDYRGEIKVALHNHGLEPQTVLKGERVAQMVITPYYAVDYVEQQELNSTVRGEGGFGSTGRK